MTRSISTPTPRDEMIVHRRVTPSIKFAGTHLYTCVERSTVRVKRLSQEHDTMSRPGHESGPIDPCLVKRTNHEATAPSRNILAGLAINDNFMQCRIADYCRYSVDFQGIIKNQQRVNYILPPEHDRNYQDEDHHSYTNTNGSPLPNIA